MSSDTLASFTTPEWVKHAVFYQIFPERFARGDPALDPENVQPWGTPPTQDNYMGGDLRGILNRLDYLSELGITAIYLNPIFHAFSNHKYNTYNYFEIDPHFGDMATFRELLDQAHQRGMRVILDGVFNHCGRGFFAFQSLLEQGSYSPHVNWFRVLQFPLHPYEGEKPANYACWWNIRSLPKLNTDHQPARQYLLDVARYWIEQGADGWRLDVPNEIKDHTFWQEFRQVVKAANPEAYIVGEIWKDASPWLDGTQFDAVMNYAFRDLCVDFFATEELTAEAFAEGIDALLERYPLEATLTQLNLFGSHDTNRFRTQADGDVSRWYAAIVFQMTYPGAPCIYYGDEIGLEGEKDPGCRGCFPWEEESWDWSLRDWTQRCIAVRHAHAALRTGAYRSLLATPEMRSYAFARWNEQERFVVVVNPSDTAEVVDVPLHKVPYPANASRAYDVLGEVEYQVGDGILKQIQVPARNGAIVHIQG
jgi:glycosidase